MGLPIRRWGFTGHLRVGPKTLSWAGHCDRGGGMGKPRSCRSRSEAATATQKAGTKSRWAKEMTESQTSTIGSEVSAVSAPFSSMSITTGARISRKPASMTAAARSMKTTAMRRFVFSVVEAEADECCLLILEDDSFLYFAADGLTHYDFPGGP